MKSLLLSYLGNFTDVQVEKGRQFISSLHSSFFIITESPWRFLLITSSVILKTKFSAFFFSRPRIRLGSGPLNLKLLWHLNEQNNSLILYSELIILMLQLCPLSHSCAFAIGNLVGFLLKSTLLKSEILEHSISYFIAYHIIVLLRRF